MSDTYILRFINMNLPQIAGLQSEHIYSEAQRQRDYFRSSIDKYAESKLNQDKPNLFCKHHVTNIMKNLERCANVTFEKYDTDSYYRPQPAYLVLAVWYILLNTDERNKKDFWEHKLCEKILDYLTFCSSVKGITDAIKLAIHDIKEAQFPSTLFDTFENAEVAAEPLPMYKPHLHAASSVVTNVQTQNIQNVEHMVVYVSSASKSHIPNAEKTRHFTTKTKEVHIKEHGVSRDTFKRAKYITNHHLQALHTMMIQDKWLSGQTSKQDFIDLFSGKSSSCEIVWAGNIGLGALKEFFNTLLQEGIIQTPAGVRSVNVVLENHVVDGDNHFISGLNSSKAPGSSKQTIKKYIELLTTHVRDEDIQAMFDSLESYDPSHR